MSSTLRLAGTVRLLAAALLTLGVAAPAAPAAVSTVTTPNPGTSNRIGGLTAFPTNDVWAVGDASSSSYSGCHGRTLTARFTGSVFAEIFETPAATPICATVNSVSGSSTSDIWAVGSANSQRDPHLRHYNGSTWTASSGATLPPPPAGARSLRTTGLNAVADLSPTNVWAVGRAMFADSSRHTLIEHLGPGRLVAGQRAGDDGQRAQRHQRARSRRHLGSRAARPARVAARRSPRITTARAGRRRPTPNNKPTTSSTASPQSPATTCGRWATRSRARSTASRPPRR